MTSAPYYCHRFTPPHPTPPHPTLPHPTPPHSTPPHPIPPHSIPPHPTPLHRTTSTDCSHYSLHLGQVQSAPLHVVQHSARGPYQDVQSSLQNILYGQTDRQNFSFTSESHSLSHPHTSTSAHMRDTPLHSTNALPKLNRDGIEVQCKGWQ